MVESHETWLYNTLVMGTFFVIVAVGAGNNKLIFYGSRVDLVTDFCATKLCFHKILYQ